MVQPKQELNNQWSRRKTEVKQAIKLNAVYLNEDNSKIKNKVEHGKNESKSDSSIFRFTKQHSCRIKG